MRLEEHWFNVQGSRSRFFRQGQVRSLIFPGIRVDDDFRDP
jgi:hypothetical protein